MNCEKLHQDIEKLKEQYNSFSSKLDFSTKEAKGKIALSEQLRNTLTLQDQILESYLPDFFEKNPELLQLNLGDRIECKDVYDRPGDICTITQLSDNSIMIGGGEGTLYRAKIDGDDKFILGDRIECKDTNDGRNLFVSAVTQLSDGGVMIGGDDAIHRAVIDENGKLNLGGIIECKDANGRAAFFRFIRSITQLSDGSIIIGERGGRLHHVEMDKDGKSKQYGYIDFGESVFSTAQLSDGSIIVGGKKDAIGRLAMGKNSEIRLIDCVDIERKNTDTSPVIIFSITQLSDNSIMIGGNNGILYHAKIAEKNSARAISPFWRNIGAKLRKIPNDFKLDLGNLIECKDADGKPAIIYSITQLSDKSIMIGGGNGTLYHATVDENGNVNLSNRIECKSANGKPASINSITQLSDDSIMIGGDDGTLYHATIDRPTLSTLKQKINMIADKKAPK